MIELREVKTEDRDLLWNINQKYLYEMTNFYDDEMDAAGNYHYGHFEEYFTDTERKALFLYDGDTLVGFAMVVPYSNIGGSPNHVMAEFTVFPHYRRKGIATKAARAIFARFPGNWEIKYNEKNAAAKGLWTRVTAGYLPEKVRLNEIETVLVFRTGTPD